MKLFCRHDWEVIAKTYAGTDNLKKLKTHGSELFLKKVLFGVTTVLLQCKKCPKIKKVEMLGKVDKQLGEGKGLLIKEIDVKARKLFPLLNLKERKMAMDKIVKEVWEVLKSELPPLECYDIIDLYEIKAVLDKHLSKSKNYAKSKS